jgi:RecB family exonuclease
MMNGQEMERHPFLDYLEGSAENINDIILEPERNHEYFYKVLADVIPGLIAEEPVARNLPMALGSWHITPGMASLSPTESFSSLEKLIYYPHEYILDRIAKIKDYSPPDPYETLLNFGNCSHRIFELLFKKHGILKAIDDELIQFVDELSIQVIREQFIALDAPEFRLQKKVFILKMHKAVKRLFYHLRKGNFVEAISEENFRQDRAITFGNIKLTGKIDLHLKTAGGQKAIIDFKWTGTSKRKKMLREEKDLQLCLYSYLLSALHSVPTAFFIIDSAQLISYKSDLFPEATRIYNEKSSKEILQNMAGKIMKAYDLRKAEIENGIIEVGLETEYETLAKNSRVWKEVPEGADFPKAYSTDSKMKDKKPSNKYSDYNVLSPVK